MREVIRQLSSLRNLALCGAVCCVASATQAATIMKLSLGNTGPDVGMVGGFLLTTDDGIAATTGNQNSAIDFVGPLGATPDILGDVASFSLGNLAASGPAQVAGSVVVQNFTGGTFSVYDPANVLLLSGSLTNSALAGTTGAPGTGSVFSTSAATVTGGTLAPLLAANSLSISMTLLNVNGGAGFAVSSGTLQPFAADASVDIAADVIPEPASLTGMALGVTALVARRRR